MILSQTQGTYQDRAALTVPVWAKLKWVLRVLRSAAGWASSISKSKNDQAITLNPSYFDQEVNL